MAFIENFQKMVWHDEEEEKSTPITAANLNRLENAVGELCSEVVQIRDSASYGKGNGWTWRKFPDGGAELILKGYKITTSFDKQWGALWYHGPWALPAFPFTLTEPPSVVATPYADSHHVVGIVFESGHSTARPSNIYGLRPDSTSTVSYSVDVVAIGRWK